MVLSGYLFAKLLDGKRIAYGAFIWNRFLRLAPLLLLVILIVGTQEYLAGGDMSRYVSGIVAGIIKPSLPNGGWPITAEFHFYLLLPALLFLAGRWKYALPCVLLGAVLVRVLLHRELGEVQTLSYWTIVGRVDQFVLGILAYRFRGEIAGRHWPVLGALCLFALFYWQFDARGGFYMGSAYPSPSRIWIYMPTIEGLAYALAIAWYDNSFRHAAGRVSRFVARIGTYSYSIYLLHFFVVFRLADAVHRHVVDLSDIHLALLFSALCFLCMVPIGYLSYRYVESPFLRFRTGYIVADRPDQAPSGAPSANG